MQRNRLKLVLWVVLPLLGLTVAVGVLMLLGQMITYFSTGADPASALNLIPIAPPDLAERLRWLPDQPIVPNQRRMEPPTRDQITDAYLRGWAQLAISHELQRPYGLGTYFAGQALVGVTRAVTATTAAGWELHQSNLHHELELHFYSDDGSIVGFSDRNLQLVQHFRPRQPAAISTLTSTETSTETYVVESSHWYDVVMLLRDGNWRIQQWQRRGAGENSGNRFWVDPMTPPKLQATDSLPPAIVTLRNQQLWVDGQPFLVAGINYYPQQTPWTRFWPEYAPERTQQDLRLIRGLGLNTVRIFISYADFGGPQVQEQMRARLNDFLNQAANAGLKVIITLFDHHTDHDPSMWAADARHLANLIPYFAQHPAILAWDLKNEADRDDGLNSRALVDGWLRFVARHLRHYDRRHLITIGWSSPEAAASLPDIVDFASFHYFDEAETYTQRVIELQATLPDKPIMLQEFTLSTWNSVFPNGHTEAEQAAYYATLLKQHRTLPTLGYIAWTLHDFESVPLSEFRYPWQRGAQAHMGVIRLDGSRKPAAALLSPNAALTVPLIEPWRRFLKPFWLLMGVILLTAIVLMGRVLVKRRSSGR